MNILLRSLLIGLVLLTSSMSFAQDDGSLSGTLRNEEGRVLANITVYLKKHTDPARLFTTDYAQTKTNGYGGYSFTDVEHGSYIMAFIDENYLFQTYERDQFTDSSTVYSSYWYGSNFGLGSPQTIYISDSTPVVIEDQFLKRTSNSDDRLPSASVTNCTNFGTEDELGSFAAALNNAKTINFECSGTLVVPEIVIKQDTTINGMPDLVFSGDDNNRIIRVQPGIKFNLSQVKLYDGESNSRPGAGLYTLGYTTLNDVEITSNSNANSGAGIYNHGQLQLNNTRFFRNLAGYISALDNRGLVIGNDVHFTNHGSSYSTSTIGNSGRLELTKCSVSGSSSNNVYAISNDKGSQMTFKECSFFDNITSPVSNYGTLNIDNSEFTNNRGDQPLLDNQGVLNLASTSIHNNTLPGSMIVNEGRANIVNTTISTNTVIGGASHGGALSNKGLMTVSFSTITNNHSFADQDNEPFKNSGELRISNSIVVANPTQCSANYQLSIGRDAAPVISDGSNLYTYDGYGGGDTRSDIKFGNAALGELKNNGGFGATHALLPGSDAIDNGSCTLTTDQRGISRPQGGQCDIGAFEVALVSQSGNCSPGTSDPDGDGWGWENNQSCRIVASPRPTQQYCTNPNSDPDNDGWGWENNQSCRVKPNQPPPTGKPTCSSANADPDGDGWGWENNASCRVGSSQPTSKPICSSPSLDPDGDGWGWENNASCRIGSN